ncbi:MAG: Asp-tRNA(Asn)/Glu-tRNA(Gln) amidotransferase subunit GatC [Thermotogota bacterium]|nr:Asp-tRNA(Asn)/Glu-tRNA(Gln) amidotransferase subunit GatC [Thermotogota bacterium]
MSEKGVNIDEKLLKRLQELSHLKLEKDEQETLKNDINKILHYIEKLKEVDIKDVDKQITTVENKLELREDEPVHFDNRDRIIDLFPVSENHYLKVPKIY